MGLILALSALLPDVGGGTCDDEEEADGQYGIVAGEPGGVAQSKNDNSCIDEGQTEQFIKFSHRFRVVLR